MARKKRKHKPKAPGPPPRFAVADPVRVKPGTHFPDYPDLPLGGWAGVVEQISTHRSDPLYLIRWNDGTLQAMPAIFRTRAKRHGGNPEHLWLLEGDLEPDVGEAPPMEQPTALVPRPLRLGDPEDRVRMIFG